MRKRLLLMALVAGFAAEAAHGQDAEAVRWRAEAQRVTITRDDWGIAHVHGKTDADAVFGMIYAQCEDDFHRVERNYLTSLGRTAEADGEKAIWQDLRQRLFLDPEVLQKNYAESPEWLKKLMDAWADGLNFYLSVHPEVKPQVLTRFQPWMALSFTEGSIGGDIERVNLQKLQAFYERPHESLKSQAQVKDPDIALAEPQGSNGIVIAPSNTRDHHALLLINPHTSFFFRSELQMSSEEGLNAYGAVTWGQFFVYQGFNDRAGWMHTSSGVDAVDEYREVVSCADERCGGLAYRYAGKDRPFESRDVTIAYKAGRGTGTRTFKTLYTLHGPVIRRENGQLVSIQLMNLPVRALEQSYSRTKARNLADFTATMDLRANSSNNTLFADADGDIAYWHGDFIPKRNPAFDYTRPVDGSTPATDWKGLMTLDEVPHLKNPASGYIFNVNDSPWNGSGDDSLRQQDYPAYVEQGIESARGLHAMRVLAGKKDFTPESLRAAAYDSSLPWFQVTLPTLLDAWDALPADSSIKAETSEAIETLRAWDRRWNVDSVATSLAVSWGTELLRTEAAPAREAKVPSEQWVATEVPSDVLLTALKAAAEKLTTDFGRWQVPWGEMNRFQRLNDDIAPHFSDAGPSIPVPFASALWGSLASYGAKQYPNTKKWYATYGNTFVAVVEFGGTVRAQAVTAGGESGVPGSKHFNDQAERYVSGNLRDVYFYPEQLKGHTERSYRPGE